MNILSSPSTNGCEDSTAMDDSTAPTTPEGSYMSSPLLRPQILESMAMCMAQDRPIRNICCVGAGYVGGPTAAVIAFNNPNIQVTVVDLNATRIRRWNSRHPPIFEPGLANIVRVARDGTRDVVLSNEPAAQTCSLSQAGNSEIILPDAAAHSKPPGQAAAANQQITVPSRQPNLFFSTQVDKCISEADIVLIAVNTPTKTRGAGKGCATDMAAFEAVTADVARHARPGAIIVEKSTVPCRTAQMVQQTMAIHRPGVHFEILSNPEFLAAGTAVHDLLYPDRVLIGCSPTSAGRRAAAALASVYGAWVARERILTTNVWSSELAKLVANSMLAQRISSINSIAAVCEETGANVDEVAAAIGADPRIGDKFLKAGIGFGGSCFKKDVLSLVYLAQSLGLDEVAAYWRQVHSMNEYSRNRFAARVVRCLNNTLAGKKMTVLGYAFKKNTNDTRESPALEIIRTLLEEGPREVAIFDPCCHPGMVREEVKRLLGEDLAFKILKEEGGPLVVYENAYEACAGSNAVLITTDFDEFRNNSSSQQKKHLHGINTGSISPDGVASAGKKLGRVVSLDLRPFESVESSELDLLSLHKHLTEQASSKFPSLGSGFTESMDPLKRFNAEPPCDVDCPDCSLQNSGYAPHEEYKTKDKIDWAKISYHMSKPRWLFDGKGVLEDIKEMELLGFCVKSVGR